VNYRIARSPVIARRLRHAFPHHNYVYLTGSPKNGIHPDEPRVYESLQKVLPGLQVFEAASFTDWLSIIKHADLLLSGRFHYSIAALCLETPAICFKSNTPKLNGVMRDLRLRRVIPRSPSLLFSWALWYQLRQSKRTNCRRSFLDACCRLAQRNFEWDL
jgi:hypothetical protein